MYIKNFSLCLTGWVFGGLIGTLFLPIHVCLSSTLSGLMVFLAIWLNSEK